LRAIQISTGTSAEKVQRLYRVLYAREATTAELTLAREYLAEAGGPAAWERYAQALLMANEFAFVD
jgi:plasmid stabilization system protein ParE